MGTESDEGPPGQPHSYGAPDLTLMPPATLSQKPQTTRPAAKDFLAPFHISSANPDKECVGPAAQGHLLGISREIFRNGKGQLWWGCPLLPQKPKLLEDLLLL